MRTTHELLWLLSSPADQRCFPDPAGLLAARRRSGRRWASGDTTGRRDALADLGTCGTRWGRWRLFDDDSTNPAPNLYDWPAAWPTRDGQPVRRQAGRGRGDALGRAAGELARALDRDDEGRLVSRNGRPLLAVSELAPNLLMLSPGCPAGAGLPGLRHLACSEPWHAARAPGRRRHHPLSR